MSLPRPRKILLLLAAMAFSVAFAQQAQADSFGGAAAEAILQTHAEEPRPAAKIHRSPRALTPHPAKHISPSGHSNAHAQSGSLEQKTDAAQAGKGKDAGSDSGKEAKKAARSSVKDDKSKSEKPAWSPAGATNLDAIKDMGPMAGLLIMGPSFGGGDAGTVMQGASQAGLGSAVVWGLIGAVFGGVFMMLIGAMQKEAGARPGTTTKSNGLSPVAVIAVFIVVFCVKLFAFPDHPVNLASSDELQLAPVYSNEFGLHCFLPKDILKAKFTEKVSTTDINVTVAGYRHGKNEMMIGYAHMPTLDQMVKAKEATSGGLSPMAQMQQAYGVKFPQASQTRYYFDVNKALDACVEAAGKRANFKVTYHCPIVVNGKLPGREYEGSASQERMVRGRVFMGYDNYYHAIVVGDQSFVNSNDAYKFLDSMDVH